MKVGFLRVAENTRLYGNTYVMWFDAAAVTPPSSPLPAGGEVETEARAGAQRGTGNADFLSGAGPGHRSSLTAHCRRSAASVRRRCRAIRSWMTCWLLRNPGRTRT